MKLYTSEDPGIARLLAWRQPAATKLIAAMGRSNRVEYRLENQA